MELTLTLSRLAEAAQELPTGGEFLDAVVAPVRHVHTARRVYRHPPGEVKLTGPSACLAPLGKVRSVGAELLHPIVVLINDVDVVIGVDGNPCRAVEFARSA